MGVFDHMRGEVFAVYSVELSFEDRVYGGVPRDPKIIQGWLRSKAGITEKRELFQATVRTMSENGTPIAEAALDTQDPDEMYNIIARASEDVAESMITGFKTDEEGPYIEDRQIKACLKESTNILFAKEKWGKTNKGPMNYVAERVFVKPKRIHLDRDQADGIELVIKHIKDAAGKRSAMGHHEYVDRPVVAFDLEVVEDCITMEQWGKLWLHAQSNGIGALRSQGAGRFEITRFERVL